MTGEVIPLGARLRHRREELGLTQAQVARELEVARTSYLLWETEAARPAPDRWRAIAKWLGVSVTAMLHAAELIDEREALDAEETFAAAGLTGENWDERSNSAAGDFFSQERATIADQARIGSISNAQAEGLRRLLARLQDESAGDARAGWHRGEFRRRFPCSLLAPALSRAALTTTAVGIPRDALDDASLLISELVTNSVTHSGSEWVDVEINLTADSLRIAVSDQGTQSIQPRTAGPGGGWGLTLVAALATRWGVEQDDDGKTIMVELDLNRHLP